ncbi:hypothetical protein XM38_031420 [Halomicronema hongdechloris C2206]|uniref:Uncharacterized protein n=1 Tax=Halomicronema hongdechloris C2206 TaxID=1641165 RepID=A0A1Z3HPF9_9CYAN|nr:hypothetical protein XM38_031420 [Halomicronema hongdechloris C2206]
MGIHPVVRIGASGLFTFIHELLSLEGQGNGADKGKRVSYFCSDSRLNLALEWILPGLSLWIFG